MLFFQSPKARHIAGQIALTVSSSGFQAACAVVALGLNARSLGAREFGVLALIQSYAALISSLATFESWQPIIRLGVKSRMRLGLTLSCGIFLDFFAAVGAGLVAILGILLFAPLTGIPQEYKLLAIIYSLSLFGGMAGTPKGFFRLSGQYNILVGNQVTQGIALVVASAILWAVDATLAAYVIVFAVIAALYNLSLLVRMFVHIKKAGIGISNPLRSRPARRYMRRVLMMATGTSLLSTLWNARRNLSLFLVGGLIGPVAAGVFAVGAKLANMVSRISGPLNQVLFPEVVKITHGATPRQAQHLMRRISLVAAAVAAILAMGGYALRDPIVSLAAGPGFEGAAIIFSILFLSECMGLAGLHLNALIQSLRGTGPLLVISTSALLLFLALSLLLARPAGSNGIALASLAGSVVMYFAMTFVAQRALRRQSQNALPAGNETHG